MRIKGFKYKNFAVNIEEPDFQIEVGDTFIFCPKRYAKNKLIGVNGMFLGRYVKSAEAEFKAKYPQGITVTEQMVETPKEYIEDFKAIQMYLKKKVDVVFNNSVSNTEF